MKKLYIFTLFTCALYSCTTIASSHKKMHTNSISIESKIKIEKLVYNSYQSALKKCTLLDYNFDAAHEQALNISEQYRCILLQKSDKEIFALQLQAHASQLQETQSESQNDFIHCFDQDIQFSETDQHQIEQIENYMHSVDKDRFKKIAWHNHKNLNYAEIKQIIDQTLHAHHN